MYYGSRFPSRQFIFYIFFILISIAKSVHKNLVLCMLECCTVHLVRSTSGFGTLSLLLFLLCTLSISLSPALRRLPLPVYSNGKPANNLPFIHFQSTKKFISPLIRALCMPTAIVSSSRLFLSMFYFPLTVLECVFAFALCLIERFHGSMR